MFRLAYNTNGLAHHRLVDALRLCAELGYEGVAITPDVGQLDPYHLRPEEVHDARHWAEDLGLELAVESGARYLLDARRKHHPTLLVDDPVQRARRVDHTRRLIDLADELGAEVLSLWAGQAPDGSTLDGPGDGPEGRLESGPGTGEGLLDRLCTGLTGILDHARERGVIVAFEPEPGMFVERPSGFRRVRAALGERGRELGLTLDVGHCLVTGDLPVPAIVRDHADELVHVHLDDIADGVHEHRMFGQGDLDLAGTLEALVEVGFDGMAAVELSRDSHRGAAAAREAMEHLRRCLGRA